MAAAASIEDRANIDLKAKLTTIAFVSHHNGDEVVRAFNKGEFTNFVNYEELQVPNTMKHIEKGGKEVCIICQYIIYRDV